MSSHSSSSDYPVTESGPSVDESTPTTSTLSTDSQRTTKTTGAADLLPRFSTIDLELAKQREKNYNNVEFAERALQLEADDELSQSEEHKSKMQLANRKYVMQSATVKEHRGLVLNCEALWKLAAEHLVGADRKRLEKMSGKRFLVIFTGDIGSGKSSLIRTTFTAIKLLSEVATLGVVHPPKMMAELPEASMTPAQFIDYPVQFKNMLVSFADIKGLTVENLDEALGMIREVACGERAISAGGDDALRNRRRVVGANKYDAAVLVHVVSAVHPFAYTAGASVTRVDRETDAAEITAGATVVNRFSAELLRQLGVPSMAIITKGDLVSDERLSLLYDRLHMPVDFIVNYSALNHDVNTYTNKKALALIQSWMQMGVDHCFKHELVTVPWYRSVASACKNMLCCAPVRSCLRWTLRLALVIASLFVLVVILRLPSLRCFVKDTLSAFLDASDSVSQKLDDVAKTVLETGAAVGGGGQ